MYEIAFNTKYYNSNNEYNPDKIEPTIKVGIVYDLKWVSILEIYHSIKSYFYLYSYLSNGIIFILTFIRPMSSSNSKWNFSTYHSHMLKIFNPN